MSALWSSKTSKWGGLHLPKDTGNRDVCSYIRTYVGMLL